MAARDNTRDWQAEPIVTEINGISENPDTLTKLIGSELANTVYDQYREGTGPFEDVDTQLPEYIYLREVDPGDRPWFITLGSAIDYQRPAGAHWETMQALWDDHPELFDPEQLVAFGRHEITKIFEQDEYWIRYPNRDAKWWVRIAESVIDDFDGSIQQLFSSHEYNAEEIHSYVRSADGYPGLGGVKICPMWLRIYHDFVSKLETVSALPIPVDAQVRKITINCFPIDQGDDVDNDDIRSFWAEICSMAGIPAFRLDAPLWLIGENYEEWGRSYIREIATDVVTSDIDPIDHQL